MRLTVSYGREEFSFEYPEGAAVKVAQALQSIREKRPGVYEAWCDGEGHLRSSVSIFVNGEHIRYRNGLDTELNDGDEVYVIPMVAGG
jgi:molybdopterin converting factor small subunit